MLGMKRIRRARRGNVRGSGRSHQPQGPKTLYALQIRRRPVAPRLSRHKPLCISLWVDRLYRRVNPPETERFFHCLGVSNRGFAGALLVIDKPDLALFRVMPCKPSAPNRAGCRVSRFSDQHDAILYTSEHCRQEPQPWRTAFASAVGALNNLRSTAGLPP